MNTYRPDIDGLRAVSVLLVLFFHAGFTTFSGGFIGVDVFFVISGYLITRLILSEIQAGTFSLAHFYERRIRRLLPALFLVMAACIPFAWTLLSPKDFKYFSQSLIAVSLFISNILFWQESGYFDTQSDLKPLLHTWGLAIEEQYYLLFPLFLMLMWRFRKQWIVPTVGVLTLISLVLAERFSISGGGGAYYLLPTRGWELAIGSLVAIYLKNRQYADARKLMGEIFSFTGLALILFAAFAFNKQTTYPGLNALPPTVGAALIILYAAPNTVIGRLLSARLMIGLGLISYSIYLWHQPIFAFAKHYAINEPTTDVYAALIALSLFLAYLSWRYVETPFRSKSLISRKMVFIAAGLASATFVAIGYAGHVKDGFKQRFGADAYWIKKLSSHKSNYLCSKYHDTKADRVTPCILGIGGTANPTLAVFGDSHANAISTALNQLGNERASNIAMLEMPGCPPLLDVDISVSHLERRKCSPVSNQQIQYVIDHQIKKVLLVAYWSLYTDGRGYDRIMNHFLLRPDKITKKDPRTSREIFKESFNRTLIRYQELGVQVYVLLQVPEQVAHAGDIYFKAYRSGLPGHSEMNPLVDRISVAFERHLEKQSYYREYFSGFANNPSLTFINPDPHFCDEDLCRLGDIDSPYYFDRDHLNAHGSLKLKDAIEKAVLSDNP